MELNWYMVLPALIPAAFGLLVLLMSPFFRGSGGVLASAAVCGLALSGYTAWAAPEGDTAAGLVHMDPFGSFLTLVVIAVALLSVLVSVRFLEREDADHGEFYALFLFAVSGMVLMINTRHLMMVLVGLEVFSISLYVLCGLTRTRVRSIESALKYFLLGAFSSGFMVYGLALLYGATGSLDLDAIRDAASSSPSPLLWAGMGLVLVGFAFKIAFVPFHHWVPDVYQGAPTNVTGFMAAATKTAAFAALLRFLVGAFGPRVEDWVPLITVLAILTMSVANLVALAQTNVKRLLAFSSIAHAGYLMIALTCDKRSGVPAIAFYLATYGFMTVGAFAVAAAVGKGDATRETGYDLASWEGLGRRSPYLAFAMTVFLVSMAGIPPTGGFLGKYLIFQAAIESHRYLLAIVGSLNAVVAAYYYLRIVVAMWMREPEEAGEGELAIAPAVWVALGVSVVAILILGIVPSPILDWTGRLAASIS